MKKRLVLVVAAAAVLALAGCGGVGDSSTTSSSSESASTSSSVSTSSSSSSSSSSQLTLTSLAITNKTALQATWYVGQVARYVTLSSDPAVNMAALLASGDLQVTSSNSDIISVAGLYISPKSEGTATITVTLGGKTDSVEISTHDIGNVTTNKISDMVDNTTNYKIIGKITAILSSSAYFIDDGTGAVEVYGNSSVTPVLGKAVVVYGKAAIYHNLFEFDSTALILESSEAVTVQDPASAVDLTSTVINAWKALKTASIAATKGVYKFTAVQNHADNYAAFSIGGFPVEPSGTDDFIDGHTYSVVCCFAGSTSSYINIVVLSKTDDTKVLASINEKNLVVNGTAQVTASDATDKNATFTYASDNVAAATVDSTGLVTAVGVGTAKITATSSTTYSASVTVYVCAPVQASAIVADGFYQVTGKVTCLTTKGYIVDDGTAGMSVYLNAAPTNVKLGDILTVTGQVTNYNQNYQFGSSATVKAATADITPTSAVTLTNDIVAGWKALTAPIVSGPLYTAIVTATKSGNYDAFDFGGNIVEPSYSTIKLTEGKQYTINAYFGGYNSKYSYAVLYMVSAVEYIPDVSMTSTKSALAIDETASLTAIDNTTTDAVTWTWTSSSSAATVVADTTDSSKATVTGVGPGTVVITATSSSGKFGTFTIVVGVDPVIAEKSIAEVNQYTASDPTVIKLSGIWAENHGTLKYGNGYLVDPTTGESALVYGCTKTASALAETNTGKGYYSGAFTNPQDFAADTLTLGSYISMECVIQIFNGTVEIVGVITSETKPTDAAYTYKYAASTVAAENGTVVLSKSADLAFGEAVTIEATPTTGYKVDTVTVDHDYGVEVVKLVAGAYSFAANVKNVVTVTFKLDVPDTSFILSPTTLSNPSSYGDALSTINVNGTDVGIQEKQITGGTAKIQMNNKPSYIYNTVAVPGAITGITIAWNSSTVSTNKNMVIVMGTTAQSVSTAATTGTFFGAESTSFTYDAASAFTFFQICHVAAVSGAMYIDSIVISFVPAA